MPKQTAPFFAQIFKQILFGFETIIGEMYHEITRTNFFATVEFDYFNAHYKNTFVRSKQTIRNSS